MDLNERFRVSLERGRDLAERQRIDDLPLDAWWNHTRDKVLRPLLDSAAKALKGFGLAGEVVSKNGNGIALLCAENGMRAVSEQGNLTFALYESEISVRSSENSLNHDWDRSDFIYEKALEKVDLFLEKAAGRYEVRPPSLR